MTFSAEATEAASLWGGHLTRLIRDRENAVYEMRLLGGARAALRLHRAGYQDEASIKSELWWCGALAKTGLSVPAPLSAQSGAQLAHLSTGRLASAIAWVSGEPLGEAGVPLPGTHEEQSARHYSLGRLIAKFHAATDALTLPTDFTRPSWDIPGLVGETPFWGRFWDHPSLTRSEADHLQTARTYLRDRLQKYHAEGADFGPIHADVLRENVLVDGETVSLIDFDDSGHGFRLHDLGTVLSQNLYEPALPQIARALIAGYATRHPADPELVAVFTMARTLASVGWTMPRLAPDDPIHRRHINRALMWSTKVMAGDIPWL
jgi:Ser/Thr protein kinase RdoA (MazF antagonist)